MASKYVTTTENKHTSRLVKAIQETVLDDYDITPKGVWDSQATIICGDVTIKSSDLDVEFSVPFDDDMEPNEAEVIVYNLSDTTINKLANGAQISIEAGYKGDTGVIFVGYISKVQTKMEESDKATTIKAIDDVSKKTVEEITYSGKKASEILKDLLNKTGTPIEVFEPRRDWEYTEDVKVDGDLMQNIKKIQ